MLQVMQLISQKCIVAQGIQQVHLITVQMDGFVQNLCLNV